MKSISDNFIVGVKIEERSSIDDIWSENTLTHINLLHEKEIIDDDLFLRLKSYFGYSYLEITMTIITEEFLEDITNEVAKIFNIDISLDFFDTVFSKKLLKKTIKDVRNYVNKDNPHYKNHVNLEVNEIYKELKKEGMLNDKYTD